MSSILRSPGARPPWLLAGAAATLLALLAPSIARADTEPGWYWLAGGNLGASIHEAARSAGFLLGPEGSVVCHLGPDAPLDKWFGFYSDALLDIGEHTGFRYSLGPELGFGPVGIDGGYAGAVYRGDYLNGVVARLFLSVGYVSLYGRYGHFFADESPYRNMGEVGLLIKYVDPRAVKKMFAFH